MTNTTGPTTILFVPSIEKIQEELKTDAKIDAKRQPLTNILKEDLDFSYRKVKKINPNANSDMNLIIRQ